MIRLLACMLVAATGLGAQQAPVRDSQARQAIVGTARLAGVVIEAGESPVRPIRRALVTITGTGIATPLQVVTDDRGRFDVANLPGGRFSVTAEKPAYLRSYYGSARPGRPPGMPIALNDGQQIANLTIVLTHGAAISGRVTDQSGGGVANAQVQVQLVSITGGERRLVDPPGVMTFVGTDDRGAYRVWGLPPGEYVVRAIGGGGFSGGGPARAVTAEEIASATRELAGSVSAVPLSPAATPAPQAPPVQITRIPSYFPGVADPAQAQSIVVAAGDDRTDVNIVSILGRVARVTGLAIGPTGQPISNISVGVANLTAGTIFTSRGGVRAGSNGEFAIASLPPGRWLLYGSGAEANTPSDGKFPWWAQTEIVVGDQDLSGVVLQFAPGSTVTGRLILQGAAAPPEFARIRVSLTPLPAIAGTGALVQPVAPQPDGSFTFDALPPGKYRVSVSAAGAWALHSAVSSGRDTLDEPLEIAPGQNASVALTMTDRPTEISGVLLDQLGRPAPEYSVIAFSADRAMWTVSPRRSSGVVKLASDGRYRIAGLPPGDYLLCVITDIEPGQLNDVSFLEQLARAGVAFTLRDGEKKVQDFKIGGG